MNAYQIKKKRGPSSKTYSGQLCPTGYDQGSQALIDLVSTLARHQYINLTQRLFRRSNPPLRTIFQKTKSQALKKLSRFRHCLRYRLSDLLYRFQFYMGKECQRPPQLPCPVPLWFRTTLLFIIPHPAPWIMRSMASAIVLRGFEDCHRSTHSLVKNSSKIFVIFRLNSCSTRAKNPLVCVKW